MTDRTEGTKMNAEAMRHARTILARQMGGHIEPGAEDYGDADALLEALEAEGLVVVEDPRLVSGQ